MRCFCIFGEQIDLSNPEYSEPILILQEKTPDFS